MNLQAPGSAGDPAQLPPATRLECGICWQVYDPALGDEVWQIAPGTPFAALPAHWRCPVCDASKAKFMVLGADAGARLQQEARIGALLDAYGAAARRMAALPVYNHALRVEAIGFREHQGMLVGIVIAPWFMNITVLAPRAGPPRAPGSSRTLEFPSGRYAFVAGELDGFGALETCSLFSPMHEFAGAGDARRAAGEALAGLFEAPVAPAAPQRSRRELLFGARS